MSATASLFARDPVHPLHLLSLLLAVEPPRIAGGVMLPLGAVALGVLGGVASTYRRTLDEADGLHEALLRRPARTTTAPACATS
ncbi:MAG: hypothetical protein JNL82_35830 [Myxococcales bacterium]|nr:hypothetical protein [Myxococcales bacterium]